MNRNFIFAFILLATLSTVYAVPFPIQLNGSSPPLCPVNAEPLTLTVSPSPIVSGSSFTFNIAGKLNLEIPPGSLFNGAFLKSDTFEIINTFSDDFCTIPGINCAIPPKTDFSTGIQKTAPEGLPGSFVIGAVLISQKDQSVLACAFIEGSAAQ